MTFTSHAGDLFKRAGWPFLPKTSTPSEVLQELPLGGIPTPPIIKAPACWRRVEEYEEREREREREAAAQFFFSPAPPISGRLIVKPTPTPQRPPLPSYLQDQALRNRATNQNKGLPPANGALTDPNPIADHVERKRFIDETLTSILGPERMKFQLSRSGHSGIDPIIAQHNQKSATQDLLNKFHARRVEERQIAKERQRQADVQEAERLRTAVLLDHYRAQYVNHVASLIEFGPLLNNALDHLNTAAGTQANHHDIPSIVSAILSQIFVPVYTIIEKMKQQIPLEEEGSKALKTAWPLDHLDSVMKWLHSLPNLPPDFLSLGMAIEVISQHITTPTPFKNPLDVKPQPVHSFYQTWTGGSAKGNFMANLAANNSGIPPVRAALALTAQKVPAAPGNPLKQEKSPPLGIPDIIVVSPTVEYPGGPLNKSGIKSYLTGEYNKLEYNTRLLMTSTDYISPERRHSLILVLKNALDMANSHGGFFTTTDCANFKTQVEHIIATIAKSKDRNHMRTAHLGRLAHDVLRFWR
ncbi:hypothetical protein NX059_011201 [Plenodomus lindquistii]|nr:hypothetical protein NX059_011201 [Plenodomus lindquistii]